MKKRVLAILMTALLAISVTACGNDEQNNNSNVSGNNTVSTPVGDNNSKTDDNSSKSDDTTSKSDDTTSKKDDEKNNDIGPLTQSAYIDILESNKFTMSMSIEAESSTEALLTDMSFAVDNDKIFISMTMNDQSVEMYYMNDNAYVIDDDTKSVLYYNAETSVDELLGESFSFDTEEMKLVETGKADFDGKECDFEKYDEESLGLSEVLYFCNGEIVAIVAQKEDGTTASTTRISLKGEVQDGLFDLPSESEYTYTDYSSFMSDVEE